MEQADHDPGPGGAEGGAPARQRELRAQGRRTLGRLLEAGREVFGERGFHAARVDDVVARAETSHGTFYLYFSNKDDLLRALVRDCEQAVAAVADRVPDLAPTGDGLAGLLDWITDFDATYRAHGPVIRAWLEAEPADVGVAAHAVAVMRRLHDVFEARIRAAPTGEGLDPSVSALAIVAMVERFAHLDPGMTAGERERALVTLARLAQRGLFGSAAE